MKILHSVGETDIKDAHLVRRKVFVEEQNVPLERDLDGLDETSEHYVGYLAEEPIAVARIRLLTPGDFSGTNVKIERVGVLPEHRGKNLGTLMMEHILDDLDQRPEARIAVLESQTHAVKFYEGLDFKVFGPEFIDAGIPHIQMSKIIH